MSKLRRAHAPPWARLVWPATALVLLLVLNWLFTPGFLRLELKDGHLYGSVIDVANRAAPVLLTAVGMTLVIATGGVDLSVGAIIAITGAVAALALTRTPLNVPAVVALALGAAGLAGLWNGLLVAWGGIPPIVATLVLMVAGRGVAQLLTAGQIITFERPEFGFIGSGHLWCLPFSVSLIGITAGVTAIVARWTALGLFVETIGSNETASRYAGVNVRLVKMFVYTWCGLTAGVAGLIVAADIKAADANNAGLYYELDAILAVVLGGTALTGGRFSLLGTILGGLLIQTLTTTILTRGVPVEYTLVVKAVVVLAVCLLQSEVLRTALLRLRRAP